MSHLVGLVLGKVNPVLKAHLLRFFPSLERVSTKEGGVIPEHHYHNIEVLKRLEAIVRDGMALPVYCVEHFREEERERTLVFQVVSRSGNSPGLHNLDFGQVYDITALAMRDDDVRDVLAVLNQYHHTHDDFTGDAYYWLEALDRAQEGMDLVRFPEKLVDPFVEKLQEVRAEIVDSHSPGAIQYLEECVVRTFGRK